MKTKNFRKKISLACGTDDLRPSMTHLHFKDGFVYATDAHILLKQNLKAHAFTDDEIELMNGKFLHAAAFNEVYRYDSVTVTEQGFICRKGPVKTIVEFTPFDGKYPDADAVIPTGPVSPIDSIGLNMALIKKVEQLTLSYTKNVKAHFRGKNKAIIFTPIDSDDLEPNADLILLMPVAIGAESF
jgi:hypothetical protein